MTWIKRNASLGRRPRLPGQMQEYRTAKIGRPWPDIPVKDTDHIIQSIVPPHAVRTTGPRTFYPRTVNPYWAVILPRARFLAPAIIRPHDPHIKAATAGHLPIWPVRAHDKAGEAIAPAGRRPVPFPLHKGHTAAAKHRRQNQPAGDDTRLRWPARQRINHDISQFTPHQFCVPQTYGFGFKAHCHIPLAHKRTPDIGVTAKLSRRHAPNTGMMAGNWRSR